MSPLFHNIFNISLISRVQLHMYLLNVVNRIIFSNYFFLNSANLICRSTDISKYFRESIGIRDNERRLYFIFFFFFFFFFFYNFLIKIKGEKIYVSKNRIFRLVFNKILIDHQSQEAKMTGKNDWCRLQSIIGGNTAM